MRGCRAVAADCWSRSTTRRRRNRDRRFTVDADEVRRLYDRDWHVEVLERRDILDEQPGFAAEGVTALHAAAWRLRRR